MVYYGMFGIVLWSNVDFDTTFVWPPQTRDVKVRLTVTQMFLLDCLTIHKLPQCEVWLNFIVKHLSQLGLL